MGNNVSRGDFFPLGVTIKDGGVNFALYSKYAERVDLLLFDKLKDAFPAQVIHIEDGRIVENHSTSKEYLWKN